MIIVLFLLLYALYIFYAIFLLTFIELYYEGDDVVNEEEIYYSTDPTYTMKLYLKKCNQDLLI